MTLLTLNAVPGFADQADDVLDAEDASLGLLLGKISSNAAFGVCRFEVFEGTYADGDTVPIPKSPIDGYVYSRDELIYAWAPVSTGSKKIGWASYGPPWATWYVAFHVEQTTGVVSCAAGYRGNPDHADRQANTNDGVLKVWTIAQRQLRTLTMSQSPYFLPHADSELQTDAAQRTTVLKDFNNSAKAGVINCEAFHMGEFANGETVPACVSPVDAYAYQSGEVFYMTSLRWTMDDNGAHPPVAQAPALDKGQLKGWDTAVNNVTRVVSTQVVYDRGGGSGAPLLYTTGRIAVVALCTRNGFASNFNVSAKATPWVDPAYAFPGYATGGAPFKVRVQAGATVRVQYQSGFWSQGTPAASGIDSANPSGVGTWDAAGNLSSTITPGMSVAGGQCTVNTHAAQLLGAFAGADGTTLVAPPFPVGNDSGVLTVPAGAKWLYLGINDGTSFADNDGSVNVLITQNLLSLIPPWTESFDKFSELDIALFFPAATLRASTLRQLQYNVQEAYCTPEIFQHDNVAHADTIALPTSSVDAYAYSRDELTYVWDLQTSFPIAGDNHNRLTFYNIDVDVATGVVRIDSYETSTSSDGWFLNHDGKLRVVVIANRHAAAVDTAAIVVAPVPGDGGGNPDASSGGITVNGV